MEAGNIDDLLNHITLREKSNTLCLAGKKVSIPQLIAAVKQHQNIEVTIDPQAAPRVEASTAHVAAAVERSESIYGVTTGFGGMASQRIQAVNACQLQNNLLSFLAAGSGSEIDSRHTRAAMLLRANVLLQGCSGIRLEIIDRLLDFFNHNAIPTVREFGSIGASGDLVPLSSIARAVTGVAGKAKVNFDDEILDSKTVLRKLDLEPIELLPKEGLALVNGTSFSSAIAANAVYESTNLMALSLATQSMMLRALEAHEGPFDPFVHQAKPHPGQIWSANILKSWLAGSESRTSHSMQNGSTSNGAANGAATNGSANNGSNGKPHPAKPVQDRYSIRCSPQYLGSIVEGIARVHQTIEIEMNSVSDNPLIDPESGRFHQSGNFLGQYIGVAMDDLRRFNGLLAKHLDVQIASLVAPEFNGGLPASLRGNEERTFNMGLKGLQITGNSIMPMLTYLGNPLVEHYPTHAEQFNQNINGLSWGAADLAWKSVEYFQQYMAVSLVFAVQSLDLRAKSNHSHFDGRKLLGPLAEQVYTAVYDALNVAPGEAKPFLFDDSDRWLEEDIEILGKNIADEGTIVDAVRPILDSFAAEFLSGGGNESA